MPTPGPFSPLTSKCEQAVIVYLQAQTIASNPTYYAGEGNDDKLPPAVIVNAGETPSEEYPEQTGNYWVDLDIIIRSIAATDTDGVNPKTAHDLLVGTVDYWMSQSDLANQINLACAAAVPPLVDFTAQFQEWKGFGSAIAGDCWESTAHLRIHCCASTLSA